MLTREKLTAGLIKKKRLWFWGSRSIFVDKQFISKHERILAESACSIDLHYRFRGNILESVQYLNFSFFSVQTLWTNPCFYQTILTITNNTGSSRLMRTSLLQISLLRFFKTITNIWLMLFYGPFILLMRT